MPGGNENNEEAESKNQPLPAKFEVGENWNIYIAQMEQYFLAYNITNIERKREILLASLSYDVFSTLSDLYFPDNVAEKTYKDICEMMKNHFSPVVSIFDERCKFYNAKQKQGGLVTEFAARLKGLTRYCKFGENFKDVVRDKFVCGLVKGPVYNKVSELEGTASLEACIEAALKKEVAVLNRTNNSEPIYNISQGDTRKCTACGATNHKFKQCKFKDYSCTYLA